MMEAGCNSNFHVAGLENQIGNDWEPRFNGSSVGLPDDPETTRGLFFLPLKTFKTQETNNEMDNISQWTL